jgi:hypothetical protein
MKNAIIAPTIHHAQSVRELFIVLEEGFLQPLAKSKTTA